MATRSNIRLIRKRWLLAAVSVLVVIGVLGASIVIMRNDGDVSVSFDHAAYTKFDKFTDVTFWIRKGWTYPFYTRPSGTQTLDATNYSSSKLHTELKAEGTEALYNNGQTAQIKKRSLTVYPYSLDKLYEVQVYVDNVTPAKPISNEAVLATNDPINVKDLQLYHVNGRLVADYIRTGGPGIDQRIIVLRDQTGDKQVSFIVNPTENQKTTKDNFDGLMEMVSSVIFR